MTIPCHITSRYVDDSLVYMTVYFVTSHQDVWLCHGVLHTTWYSIWYALNAQANHMQYDFCTMWYAFSNHRKFQFRIFKGQKLLKPWHKKKTKFVSPVALLGTILTNVAPHTTQSFGPWFGFLIIPCHTTSFREWSVTEDGHMMGQTQFGCVKHYSAIK